MHATWAVTVIRYSGAILNWTQAEVEDFIGGAESSLHSKSNMARLDMKRADGGRVLIRVKKCGLNPGKIEPYLDQMDDSPLF